MAKIPVLGRENANGGPVDLILISFDGDVLFLPAWESRPNESKVSEADLGSRKLEQELNFTRLVKAIEGWHLSKECQFGDFGADPFDMRGVG